MTFVCVNVCVIMNFGEYKQKFFVRSVTIRGGGVYFFCLLAAEKGWSRRGNIFIGCTNCGMVKKIQNFAKTEHESTPLPPPSVPTIKQRFLHQHMIYRVQFDVPTVRCSDGSLFQQKLL